MTLEELEVEILKLEPKARAHLAQLLLQSLETLSDKENAELWVEEAERRNADLESNGGRSASEVFRDARAKLK